MSELSHAKEPQAYWHPLFAGIALGVVLLVTFVVTGHGLGATGFTTRLVAWIGMVVVPSVTEANDYFCLLYTSPSPRDRSVSRMPSSA